jgi:hypothetical protein
MMEAEWLECTRPGPMLVFLVAEGHQRHLLLFKKFCLLRLATLDQAQVSRVEQGRSIEEAARAVAMAAWHAAGDAWGDVLAAAAGDFGWSTVKDAAYVSEEQAQVKMLRHLIGNPFQTAQNS